MEINSFLWGIVICFLLRFCLGLERQVRRRYIGLRTMILVAIGSYVFVSFSFLVTGYQIDISRVASQVVAGIGFLGAGVIIKDSEKNKIRGLTTAATLWCDAGIGILCAGGFILEAVIATIVVLFANIVLRYFNSFVNSRMEEKNINEVFEIKFNDIDECSKFVLNIDNYKENYKFIEINKVDVSENDVSLIITVRKNVDNKLDKFILKMVNDYNIKKYNYTKISENRIEDSFDEL